MRYSQIRRKSIFSVVIAIFLLLTGCVTLPPDALKPGPESLADRQLQTRRFEGILENDLLSASSGVLQDLGYTLTESETKLGVIVADKDRDATDAGQVAAAIFIAMFGGGSVAIDKNQKIRVSLVARPASDSNPKSHYIRVTFQRIVWNTQNQVTRIEPLRDPKLYEGFFEKLSKAVFLEGHKI